MEALNRRIALGIFAVLVLAAPLLFGAVDRAVQIGLTFALGLGLFVFPPALPKLPRWLGAIFLLTIVGIFAKEFLPQTWFGADFWRESLTHDYELALPFTHNPEPSRALDTILAVAVAAAFFIWARMLASEPATRIGMAWALSIAALLFALACIVQGTRSDWLIFGARYTPGWTGYGPFPNRNHTASLLAMGTLIGCGCTVRAARRKNYVAFALGLASLAIIFVALVQTRSRGGLIGCGFGLLIFGVLTVSRVRTAAAFVSAFAGVFVSAGLLLAFGAKLLARFDATAPGNIPNNIRWDIWQDTLAMWKTAPLLGFGLDSFAQIFPLFQTVRLDDQFVLHPESSWLLWLVELGAIPVLLLVLALLIFLGKNVRDSFANQRGFYIRAGAFAGVAALLCHSAYDIPAHRWGTAWFGLALLALACPPPTRLPKIRLERRASLVPLAIAAFWLLPFLTHLPLSSPTSLRNLLYASAATPTLVPAEALREEVRYFPLDPDLHQALGLRYLTHGASSHAWNEFRITDHLASSSWQLPATQAWIAAPYSAGMAQHFWSVAIDRSGHRAPELFEMAYQQTSPLLSTKIWAGYAREHPEFLNLYSECVADPEEARGAYALWWATRALGGELMGFEPAYFYRCAYKWGTRGQLDAWMAHYPQLAARDFKDWASLLHRWGDDAAAWKLLAQWVKEPDFPRLDPSIRSGTLEATWFADPANTVNAQAFAADLTRRGDLDRSQKLIFKIAAGQNPPAWFVQKAAWLYAAGGDYANAVAVLLRDPRG